MSNLLSKNYMPEIVLMPLAFFIKRELFYNNSGGACNSPRLLHKYALHPLHNATIFLDSNVFALTTLLPPVGPH